MDKYYPFLFEALVRERDFFRICRAVFLELVFVFVQEFLVSFVADLDAFVSMREE